MRLIYVVCLLILLPEKPWVRIRGRLNTPEYSIVYSTRYLFPSGSLPHDSSAYFSGSYLTVKHKASLIMDSVKIQEDDCLSCPITIKDLTESAQVWPLLLQVVTDEPDLFHNSFIGYRNGRLQELFYISDTEEKGVQLKRTDGSTLSGFTFGIDEIVGAVEHNYPVQVDLKTFAVIHPLPATQYIGFKTAAAEEIRAYQVKNGQLDSSSLATIHPGDSLTIDTFYRARQKVRLLLADGVMVEVKFATARKKLVHPPAAG